MPSAGRRGVAAGLAAAFAFAACSSGPGALPPVPKFTPAATTTTGIDYSAVGLKGVSGHATTTVLLGPGGASVLGVVVGADGAIAGASVNIERIVDGVSASTVVTTADDGTFALPAVLGGRYRIRAWRVPDLAQTGATGVFVGASESKSVELHLREVGGVAVGSSLAPDPPELDRPSNLVLLVTRKTVGDDGVVRATPLSGVRVDLIGSSGWRVNSSNPAYADTDGTVAFTVQCRAAGRQPLAATVGGEQTVPLDLNNCAAAENDGSTTTTGDVGTVPTTREVRSTTTTTRDIRPTTTTRRS